MNSNEAVDRHNPYKGDHVNVYGTVESRPRNGTFDVYSVQPTLLAAGNWYLEQKGLPLVDSPEGAPGGLLERPGPDGMSWVLDGDSTGGFVTVVRYTMPILEVGRPPVNE